MAELTELFQSADWKKEKHVPVIDAPSGVKKGEFFKVTVCVGKEVPHPNTTEHHICWIDLYLLPEGEKFPCHIGRCEFNAHGESVQGPNTGAVYAHPEAVFTLRADKSGVIYAFSFCNIHGLWKSSKEVSVA